PGVPAARLPPLKEAMSCNARRCRKAPSLAAASSEWAGEVPPTMFSAVAMWPDGTAASSAVARPILQLAQKVFDNRSIASMTSLIQKEQSADPARTILNLKV